MLLGASCGRGRSDVGLLVDHPFFASGPVPGHLDGESPPRGNTSQALFHPSPCRDPEPLVGRHSPPGVPGRLSVDHHRRPGQGSPWGQVAPSSSLQASSCLCSVPPSTQRAPRPATVDTCPRVSWLPTCSLWLSLAGRRGVSGTVPSFPTPASVLPPLAGPGGRLGAPGGRRQQGDPCRRGPLEDPGWEQHTLVPPQPLARHLQAQFNEKKTRSPSLGHYCTHFKGPHISPRILAGVKAPSSCLALHHGTVGGVGASGFPSSPRPLPDVGCGFVVVCFFPVC